MCLTYGLLPRTLANSPQSSDRVPEQGQVWLQVVVLRQLCWRSGAHFFPSLVLARGPGHNICSINTAG